MADDHRPNMSMATPEEIQAWLVSDRQAALQREFAEIRLKITVFVTALGMNLAPWQHVVLDRMAEVLARKREGRA